MVRTNAAKQVAYTVAAVGRPWPTLTAIAIALILVVRAGATDFGLPPVEGQANDRVGLSTATEWLPQAEGYAYLQRARAAGVGWIREDFTWSTIEPTRGHFSWSRTDVLMRNASMSGLKVLAIATYAPGWASGHYEGNKFAPLDPADYAAFVKAVADRYARGGTFWRQNPKLVPSPLTAIEFWNEPWLSVTWGPRADPQMYARVVRAAATAVKADHPGMTLLASGDVPEDFEGVGRDWFRSTLLADPELWRSGLVDAWSVHLYCHNLSPWNTTAPAQSRFDRLLLTLNLADQAGADKPIWITEFGWRTDAGNPDSVSEQIQAQYVREALIRAMTEWRSVVARSFVYTWAKPSTDPPYNLLRPDGSPRPAWQAIQGAIASAG